MRALLKAVPVAIIIEEGKRRFVRGKNALEPDRAERPDAPSLSKIKGIRIGSEVPIGAKIQDHFFQNESSKSGTTDLKPRAAARKKKKDIPVGLQVVEDIHQAFSERKRLVNMLEEFADFRAQK